MGMDPLTIGLGAAAIGGIGGAMGGKDKTTTQTGTSAPWDPQQQYLKYGFGQAQNAYDAANGLGTFQGQRVAGLNPFQTQGYNLAGNFGLGQGYNFGLNQAQTGNDLLGGLSSYQNNASNLFNQYQNGDPTAYALNTANQYANSPYMDGLVDAAGRDVTRQLNEQALPSVMRSAVGSGNTNSTRAGVQSAILQRGAEDRLGDISSTLRGNAFNTGLSAGLNQYNTNLSNLLSANNQLYNAGQAGSSLLNNGLKNVYTGANNAASAGQGFQAQDQNVLDANKQAFSEQQNNQLDLLAKYMQLVGGNYGSQSTSTSTTPGSPGGLQGALGGALGGFGMAANLLNPKKT